MEAAGLLLLPIRPAEVVLPAAAPALHRAVPGLPIPVLNPVLVHATLHPVPAGQGLKVIPALAGQALPGTAEAQAGLLPDPVVAGLEEEDNLLFYM